MKNKLILRIGCVAAILLIIVFGGNIIKEKLKVPVNSTDSSSKITVISTEITQEEAISLKSVCENSRLEDAKNSLLETEDQILTQLAQTQKQDSDKTVEQIIQDLKDGKTIRHYSCKGEFSYPENPEYKGELEARIIVVCQQDGSKKIEKVDWISSHMTSDQDGVQWVQSIASSNIEVGGVSARIASTGYFTALNSNSNKNLKGFENPSASSSKDPTFSKTVYPEFNFYI